MDRLHRQRLVAPVMRSSHRGKRLLSMHCCPAHMHIPVLSNAGMKAQTHPGLDKSRDVDAICTCQPYYCSGRGGSHTTTTDHRRLSSVLRPTGMPTPAAITSKGGCCGVITLRRRQDARRARERWCCFPSQPVSGHFACSLSLSLLITSLVTCKSAAFFTMGQMCDVSKAREENGRERGGERERERGREKGALVFDAE